MDASKNEEHGLVVEVGRFRTVMSKWDFKSELRASEDTVDTEGDEWGENTDDD